jgi:hypothetical protein
MGINREIAIGAMKATDLFTPDDFLRKQGIATPVPQVAGAIPAVAREEFMAREIDRLMDLIVIFSIGDFPEDRSCSSYFNPHSPWYNVFYGAYGIRSYKRDGSAWGFNKDGSPNFDEITQVPALDYNFLTAGELGCPPDRMAFGVTSLEPHKMGAWDVADVRATIPSGLHLMSQAVKPNLEYYAVFGFPDADYLSGGRQSYEPVKMHGQMFFRAVAPQITLVWGGLCPDTQEGNALLKNIVDAMKPMYG